MGSFVDLSGQRFGRLTAVTIDSRDKNGRIKWKCICDCGNTTYVTSGNLRRNHIKSCGCLVKETEAKKFLSNSSTKKENQRLYSIYKSMRSRCYSEKNVSFNHYGGRGIKICDQWLGNEGFDNFVTWSKGHGYSDYLTIDRIDNEGNYSPDNCRWVTCKENENNKRNNRYIECNGQVMTLSQWADHARISPTELKRRLDSLKLPIEVAISYSGTPMTTYNGKKISIRNLAQQKHIDYKYFIYEILVNKRSAEEVISDDATRQSIQRMIQQMEQQ